MHPIYEYMVGDTVSNTGSIRTGKQFITSRKKFFIKEATALNCGGGWQNHYKGFIENLGNHLYDEDELCTCRMVLIEKNKLFVNGK